MNSALLALAALLQGAAPPPAAGGGNSLLSIAGIALGPNEYVESFTLDTWGVDILAVCRIPPGWEIRAGREATPAGVIAGQGSHGVTFLDRRRLGALEGLVLVRLHQSLAPGRRGPMPAAFSGTAAIGTYGTEPRERRAPLGTGNIRLAPATRCPPP